MGSGSADKDLIARLKIDLPASSLTSALKEVEDGLRQLALRSNDAFKSNLINSFKDDIARLTQEIAKVGRAYQDASDELKAAAKVSETVTKQQITDQKSVADAAKQQTADMLQALRIWKEQGTSLFEQMTRAMEAGSKDVLTQTRNDLISIGEAWRNLSEEERQLLILNTQFQKEQDDQRLRSEQETYKAEEEAAKNASRVAIEAARSQAAVEKELDAQRRQYAQNQESFLKNLTSGNISGLISQFTSGGMAGLGQDGISGMLGSYGQGASTSLAGLGIDIGAPEVGAIMLAVQALGMEYDALRRVAEGYIQAYNSGQDFLGNLRMLQKEIGTGAQDTSVLNSFMGLTQNPNSPFSAIIFEQVQANLQQVADIKAGLTEAPGGMGGGQVKKMADELDKLSIKATDASGKVKDIVQFTLELNQAVQGMDAGKYAQTIQMIGGLFGQDFAAVVGSAPENLKYLADTAVQVSQQQLVLAETRKVALQGVANEEMRLNLAITQALTPVDILAQHLKVMTIKGLLMEVDTLRTKGIGGLINDVSNAMSKFLDDPVGVANKIGRIVNGEIPKNNSTGVGTGTQGTGNVRDDLAATAAFNQTLGQMGLLLKEATQAQTDYNRSIKDMQGLLTDAESSNSKRVQINSQGVSSFDSTLSGVISGAKGYDSYYKQINDLNDKVAALDKKGNTLYEAQQLVDANGQPIQATGTAKAITAYIKAYNTAQAKAADEAILNAARIADLQVGETLAAQRAAATPQAKGKPPKGLTPAQILSYQQRESLIQNGTNVDRAKQQIEQQKLADLAKAAGIDPGQAPTIQSATDVWVKQGLSDSEVQQRQQALEALRAADMADAEAQFNTMKRGSDAYIQGLIKEQDTLTNSDGDLKKRADIQKQINDSTLQSAQSLQSFAQSAGLFDSAGFTRSLAEAALQAKLANGEFGKGPDALKAYSDAFKNLETSLGDLKGVLSGRDNITVDQAQKAGILRKDSGKLDISKLAGDYSGQLGQLGDASLRTRIENGQVGAAEVADLLTKKQGLDTSKGIMGIYDETIKSTADQAMQLATRTDDEIKKIFSSPYMINVKLSDATFQDIKDQLQQLGVQQAPGATSALGSMAALAAQTGITLDTNTPDAARQSIAALKEAAKQSDFIKSHPYFYQVPQPLVPPSPAGPTGMPGIPTGTYIGPWGTPASQAQTPSPWSPFMVGGAAAGAAAGGLTGALNVDRVFSGDWSGATDTFKQNTLEVIKTTQTDIVDQNPLKTPEVVDTAQANRDVPLELQQLHTIFQNLANGMPVTFPAHVSADGTGGGSGSGGEGVTPPPPPVPTRAVGGSVYAGFPYLVGEKGPEILWANYNGYITDAMNSARFMRELGDRQVYGRNGVTINNTSSNHVSIDARGAQSPTATVQAVKQAAAVFISDDPRVSAQFSSRRKGR